MNERADNSRRSASVVMAAVFVALIILPGLYDVVFALRAGDVRKWERWFANEPTGRTLREIERDFDQRFPVEMVARTVAANVPLIQLRPVQAMAESGRRGFLFLAEEQRLIEGPGFVSARLPATAAIEELSRELKARGIHLLVVPVPAKASIYPELLDSTYDMRRGAWVNREHGRWIAELEKSAVDVFDPTELMWEHRYDAEGYVFHPTDTHWTFRAMDMTAAAVAKKIGPMVSGEKPARKFQTRVLRYSRSGDLFGREGVAPAEQASGGIHEERVQVFDENGVVLCRNEAPVLVIGDSFAEFFTPHGSGFAQTLMRHVEVDVQSAAVLGGRGDTMRKELNRAGILDKKRVVVMVFAIRHVGERNEWHAMRIGE